MPPDPKPTAPPDGKMIPVRTLTLLPGMNGTLPGKKFGSNAVSGSSPSAGEYWSIGYDPRLRSFRVAYHEPGKDLDRAPSALAMIAEGVVFSWVPAVALP